MIFSKSCLEENPFGITGRILKYVRKHRPELILIEWNGMEHFHRLEEMLLQFSAKAAVSVEKVVYVADEAGLQYKIPDAGAAAFHRLPEVTALLSGQEVTAISLRMPEFF